MNLRRPLLVATVITLGMVTAARAQDVSKDLQVKVSGVKVGEQNTPQYTAPNVVEKRFRPKKWLEMDVAFTVKKLNPKDRNPIVDAIECKFFVALGKQGPDGRRPMLTATATFLDADEKERENHLLMYASPQALFRLLEKDFAAADVVGWGIEIYHSGSLAGWESSQAGKRWWADAAAANMTPTDGVLQPKAKTEFGPLWGDYDLKSK